MARVLSFLIAGLLIILSSGLQAELKNENSASLSGIKKIGQDFQIFPENKIGNTVYKKNKALFSAENLMLRDIIEAPGGYVYHAVNSLNNSTLGFIGAAGTKFKALGGGFYQLRAPNSRKKLYRLDPKNKIQDLLAKSYTASGLAYNNVDKAAFFHVTKGETVNVGDEERYKYWFVIHIVWNDREEVVSLPELVSDFYLNLRLKWENKNNIKYILSNGYSKSIHIE